MDDGAISVVKALSALPEGATVRGFEILSVLGGGKSSLTYKAHDLLLDRPVAIKEYLPAGMARRTSDHAVEALPDRAEAFEQGRMRFLVESQHMARFRHQIFREALQLVADKGTVYIVMPYFEGITIRKMVRDGWRINDLGDLLITILPILGGVSLLHNNHYCHCDITPNNILIRVNDSPVLLDFGAVQLNGVSDGRPVIDLAPGFAAKEQYESSGIIGPWTDIYAISALTYYMVTGNIPDTSVSRIVHDSLTPLEHFATTGLSRNVLKVFDQGLAVEPENRFDSITDFATALQGAIKKDLSQSASPIALEEASTEKALASLTPRYKDVLHCASELREQLRSYTGNAT
jgi:serine/threonine protein kinase